MAKTISEVDHIDAVFHPAGWFTVAKRNVEMYAVASVDQAAFQDRCVHDMRAPSGAYFKRGLNPVIKWDLIMEMDGGDVFYFQDVEFEFVGRRELIFLIIRFRKED